MQQQGLAEQLAALGKPTVVVELSGMAVGMDYIANQSDWPLLVGGYGGRFGPDALAQILFGEKQGTCSRGSSKPVCIYLFRWRDGVGQGRFRRQGSCRTTQFTAPVGGILHPGTTSQFLTAVLKRHWN